MSGDRAVTRQYAAYKWREMWIQFCALLILIPIGGVWSYYEGSYRRAPRRQTLSYSYPRDWDTDWPRTQAHAQRRARRREDWELGDPVPEYHYPYQGESPLRPRMTVVQPAPIREIWHSQQRGSVVIPHRGASVRVGPQGSTKMYRAPVTSSTVSDGTPQRRRGHRSHRQRNKGTPRQQTVDHAQYSQDQPVQPKVCARCPSDRAVLAKKGSTSVLMETPPVIPCHTWSSVEKVKQEVVAGPQPGDSVPEGSHKIVIRLYRHRRTLDTCVTRYNVIVRKCPELEVGPGVRAVCSLGKAWGSRCNMSCDPGYELEGDVETECSDDLEWSGVMPLCVATTSCPRPVSPENGHLSCRTPRHQPIRAKDMLPDGSVCHYLCDSGYTIPPAQQHLVKVRCVAGSWDSDQDPICLETNELEEEEPPPEITAEDAIRFDDKECPENYCHNGGKCMMILDEPMCSCKPGFSGSQCEDPNEPDLDPDEPNAIDESNTIT